MESPREKLLKKFARKPRLIPSEIGRSAAVQSALNELLAAGAIRKLDAFYLTGHEPSVHTEKAADSETTGDETETLSALRFCCRETGC